MRASGMENPLAFSYICVYFKGTSVFPFSLSPSSYPPRDTLRQNVDITATRRSIYHYGVRSRDDSLGGGSSESPGFIGPCMARRGSGIIIPSAELLAQLTAAAKRF